jgi:hypothetical protein
MPWLFVDFEYTLGDEVLKKESHTNAEEEDIYPRLFTERGFWWETRRLPAILSHAPHLIRGADLASTLWGLLMRGRGRKRGALAFDAPMRGHIHGSLHDTTTLVLGRPRPPRRPRPFARPCSILHVLVGSAVVYLRAGRHRLSIDGVMACQLFHLSGFPWNRLHIWLQSLDPRRPHLFPMRPSVFMLCMLPVGLCPFKRGPLVLSDSPARHVAGWVLPDDHAFDRLVVAVLLGQYALLVQRSCQPQSRNAKLNDIQRR